MSSGKTKIAGWRNDYRSTMPLTERWIKDLSSALRDFLNKRKHGKLRVCVAYPDYPSKKTTLYKITQKLGFRLTNKPLPNADLILYFEDITHGDSSPLLQLYPNARILNVNCTDISKKKVDEVHLAVFGYNTFVDPTSYQGKAVVKSDTNALHDGRIITCPTNETIEGSVYQVLINNQVNENFVMDYRLAVVGSEVVHAYKKFKRMEVRFTNDVTYSERHEPSDHFSSDELSKVVAFAQAMGADFCELDVLRNLDDGKMYIIDVNKTPYGPPFGLHADVSQRAVEQLASALTRNFL